MDACHRRGPEISAKERIPPVQPFHRLPRGRQTLECHICNSRNYLRICGKWGEPTPPSVHEDLPASPPIASHAVW